MATEWLQEIPKESIVHKAYAFALDAHKNETRMNGDPYVSHCLEVGKTCFEWHLGEIAVTAALLHDVVENTGFTIHDIKKNFGDEIAFLVEGLTKLEHFQYPSDPDVENLRKFIISFSEDLRVLIIKLADRLHNMRTLEHLPKERQERFAWETMEIYAPLAYRLGMQRLSGELDDLAFPYVHPEEYKWLLKETKGDYAERQEYAQKVVPIITRELEKNGIYPIHVDSRAKRYFSLYRKLLRYDMDFSKIYDLVALRIITKTVTECYAALGVVHQLWQPFPNRFKDYIARPKANGYRSLHTTVFCIDSRILEVQIRTEEMHEENELGIAAHWAYEQVKNSKKRKAKWKGVEDKKELAWVSQLRNWQENFTGEPEFLEDLKTNFFKDRVFVLTPENDIIDLTVGATPIDFAYRIHSDVGDQCVGAKVNGNIVPLEYELHSGDVVEIVTQRGKKPSESWLSIVKTVGAKKHIRNALNAGRRILRKKAGPAAIEFKAVTVDRPGYLKDVTSTFANSKTNIISLSSQVDSRMKFATVTARTGILPQQKIEKLLVKLKKITGTREVSHRFVQ